jgi:hypothetical protein
MSAVPVPGVRPVEMVAFIPVRARDRDPSARAVAAGPQIATTTHVQRTDGKREVREETLQDGVRVGGNPPWFDGPAPFRVERAVIGDPAFRLFRDETSIDERRSFVSKVVADRLYADGVREHRATVPHDQHPAWAVAAAHGVPAVTNVDVLCLELLRFPAEAGVANALLIVHARVTGNTITELVNGLRLVAMSEDPRRPAGRRGRAWIAHLARGTADLAPEHVEAYHLAFESPEQPLPVADADAEAAGWTRKEQWLWTLATLNEGERYAVGEQNRKQLATGTHALSASWEFAVMRRGAAIVTEPVDDPWEMKPSGGYQLGFLGKIASMLARSLFTDALALGLLKGLMLTSFMTRMADLGDPVADPVALAKLDKDVTRFRNRAWWDDMGRSGQASLLLRNYGAAVGLSRHYERLVADLSDYSQKVERDAVQESNTISQGTNALIGLVTCFGIPLAALQVFTTDKLWVWIAIGMYMVLLGVAPAGDQMIAGLVPARFRPHIGTEARAAWCVLWFALIVTLLLLKVIPADTT